MIRCKECRAKLPEEGMFWKTLVSVVIRFVLLLLGVAGVAYLAAFPGHHPVSAAVSPLLLLAYWVIGELSRIPAFGASSEPRAVDH